MSEPSLPPPEPQASEDDERIRSLLERDGWPYEKLTEDVWRTWVKTQGSTVPVVVRYDRRTGMVRFAVVPLFKSPADPAVAEPLYVRLLELNTTMRLAKYGIDDDLDVFLSVEYPAVAMDPREFHDALEVIAHYLTAHEAELRALVGSEIMNFS
ncbi:MAG: YbjN domain-containing protein [Polyangiales bacterium]